MREKRAKTFTAHWDPSQFRLINFIVFYTILIHTLSAAERLFLAIKPNGLLQNVIIYRVLDRGRK